MTRFSENTRTDQWVPGHAAAPSSRLRFVVAGLGLVAALLCAGGCGGEPTAAPVIEQSVGDIPEADLTEEAPQIPPASTLVMDFSDFGGSGTSKAIAGFDPLAAQEAPHQNWSWAHGNVVVWQTILTVGMAIPVAGFLESFNHEPVQQPDGSWVWSYGFTAVGAAHTAELHALAQGGDIYWDMFVSKEGEYTDFNWFSGVANLVATEGTWTLNRDPDDPTPFVGIVWHRSALGGTGDITYTNIVPDGPENGGYISYGSTSDTPYNAYYDIYNKGKDNRTLIQWNLTTTEGRVSDPFVYGDDEWHCWNAAHEDIDCTTSATELGG